ncbi:hypothetical protein [Priestia aryabhattai]|uniref:hypothetical protein n=1 Tax=Priestia aryabhattai TaxID=412384 RepID=UPI002E1CFE93|nr:hypothetical protein [Priestia aryabhattai]MED4261366.1 hypothetical protein [Priestia aryabhattai]
MLNPDKIQVYITVDQEGKIVLAEIGEKIIPTIPYDFFFLVDEETQKSLQGSLRSYKVVLNGMKPELVYDNALNSSEPTTIDSNK